MQTDNLLFSVFPKGYRNKKGEAVLATRPQESRDIRWVYDYIKSNRARWATETLRSMMATASKEELSDFKCLHFETATFNGIFTYRNARSLVARSPFIVLDIDDLQSTEEARLVQQLLCKDKAVETALCFVSPKSLGVKWIAHIPYWAQSTDFKTTFLRMQLYVGFQYGISIDKSGSDVCRACFLPFDENCFINPLYLSKDEQA